LPTAPLRFPGGAAEYVSVFEPLLFEEAREALRSEWQASCEASAHFRVRLSQLREDGDGWYKVRLEAAPGEEERLLGRAGSGALPDGAAAVLSLHPPGRDPLRDLAAAADAEDARNEARAALARGGEEEGELPRGVAAAEAARQAAEARGGAAALTGRRGAAASPHVAGFVVRAGGELSLRLNVTPSADEPPGAQRRLLFQPSLVLSALRIGCDGAHVWSLAGCGRLSSALGEFRALHAMRRLPPHLRSPLLEPPAAGARGAPRYATHAPPPLALQLGTRPFMAHLAASFNDPQRMAIHWAAGGAGGAAWPFTLVQGPPGTGKTTTVWGILNVLHLTAYQRYYGALVAALAPRSAAAQRDVDAAVAAAEAAAAEARAMRFEGDDEEDGSGALAAALGAAGGGHARSLARLAPKPRILVCCPSNAAVDSLLEKVITREFVQANGGRYRPEVARLAAEDADLRPRVREVAVGARVEALLSMRPAERAACTSRHLAVAHALKSRIAGLRASAERAAASPARPGLDALLGQLVEASEQYDRSLVEASRLLAVADGGESPARLRCALEASFVNEAELVFTTLASAGRSVFGRLEHGFETVLIDEAAQASELQTLLPLAYGAQAVVLVGDPQQLPATVLSEAARAGLLCRSLFERLQLCGGDALLLSVQYRMHPSIRAWPGAHFYGGRLVDGDSVLAAPDEPFYSDPFLRPYLFYDVAGGREQRAAGGGGSLHNISEAQLAAALYARLSAALPAGAAKGRVCFVTPYRRQREAIEDALKMRLGPGVLADVSVNTVDSFQGQESDVVVLSLVRAAAPPPEAAGAAPPAVALRHALGFVTDVRRMNVALTRARRALWILGSAASLAASPEWASLLEDARGRGCVITDASAALLFPADARLLAEQAVTLEVGRAGGGRKRTRAAEAAGVGPGGAAPRATEGLNAGGMGWSRPAPPPPPPPPPPRPPSPTAPQAEEEEELGGCFTTTTGARVNAGEPV